MSITDDIKSFLVEKRYLQDAGSLGVDDSLLEEGIIDSVGIQDLVMFLEKQYAIKVEEDDLMPDNFDSLNAIADFVNEKK